MLTLDGGLGTEIENIVSIKGTNLWAGRILIDQPELIEQVHRRFVDAGSEWIFTSTYQTSYASLLREGIADPTKVWQKGIEVAQQAISGRDVKVVASIGPYGCYVNDGSEYTGKYSASVEDIYSHHLPMVQFFNTSGADMIAFETVPNAKELQAILQLPIEKPFYISFCLNETFGTSDIIAGLKNYKSPLFTAVGLNCVDYELISQYITQLKDFPLLVYPNYGGPYSHPDLSNWASHVRQWASQSNVVGIGGCCGTGAEEIAVIARVVKSPGP